MDEPDITINGTRLTPAQAMTVRAALGGFAIDLQEEGLGDDEHGRKMTEGYQARLSEIFKLIG